MHKNTSILIVGVGGQGILRLSDILCEVAMGKGYDVKKSEVHGMAQRGGSVSSHVRFGERVYSPLIPKGKANFLVALEQLEALRFIEYLDRENGYLFYDPLAIPPPEVYTGERDYPLVEKKLFEFAKNVVKVPCFEKALELGNVRVQNVVMLGVLSKYLKIEDEYYIHAIKKVFKEKFWELNIKAFEEGKKLADR